VGLYGVTSHAVAQRTREIGVRTALGARPLNILTLVLRHGVALTLVGVASGLAGGFGLAHLLRSLLYEVEPVDPSTFSAATGLMLLVALVACWVPARRAVRVEPAVALRHE
jgi:ABC-type antimicrobial peptide transport system permease subunit